MRRKRRKEVRLIAISTEVVTVPVEKQVNYKLRVARLKEEKKSGTKDSKQKEEGKQEEGG